VAETLPPGTPEVDDPLLVADLIALLSIKGAIGKLPLADIVIPVVNLGDVVTAAVEVRGPVFRSTDVFSEGTQTAPGAGDILADTGALMVGEYDVMFMCGADDVGSAGRFISIEHRNAANDTTLATWLYPVNATTVSKTTTLWPMHGFSYVLGDNERLRAVNVIASSAGSHFDATIFARLRT